MYLSMFSLRLMLLIKCHVKLPPHLINIKSINGEDGSQLRFSLYRRPVRAWDFKNQVQMGN
jgi:hypothetical protein